MKTIRRLITLFCLTTLTLVLLSGCKTIESYYSGYTSRNTSNLNLPGNATYQGNWKTFDIQLDYTAERNDNLLNISGTIELGYYYTLNSAQITKLAVYLFFIDDEAKVLKTIRISDSVAVQADDPIHFNKSLQIPSLSKAISFGYDGESQGDGGEDNSRGGGGSGGTEWFAKLPKRSDKM